MPAKRELTMKQIRHILRLSAENISAREMGRRLGVARATAQSYLARIAKAGLVWPLPDGKTDAVLEAQLFAKSGTATGARRRVEPDWKQLAREIRRPGVTLMVLWEEYRVIQPCGYGYPRFCDLSRAFEKRLSPVMRQHHEAGDRLSVDCSGKKIGVVDGGTGEIRWAEIFVGVLGASSLVYAEATWTQGLPDWIGAHVRMLRFLGGVPRLLVPDNLKSGVSRASFYDPETNRSYAMMAAHYNITVLPARPRKPKDKARVESGVRFVQRAILGGLRNQTFFTLAEVNAAIAGRVDHINSFVMRRLGTTRRQLFETIEKSALKALPLEDYAYAQWRMARVGIDCHVEVDGFFYSVPHALIRAEVEVRSAGRTIEVFHRGQRVATHGRRYGGRRHGTDREHMPGAHRRYAGWSHERLARWAAGIGPNSEGLILAVLAGRPHPEQGFRTCLGILRLFRGVSKDRAEAVSAHALAIGALNPRSVASIIATGAERKAHKHGQVADDGTAVVTHANIRGAGCFH